MQRRSRRGLRADVLSLAGTKQSLGPASGDRTNGGCTRYCGRGNPATWPAPHHRSVPYHPDLRYRPRAGLQPARLNALRRPSDSTGAAMERDRQAAASIWRRHRDVLGAVAPGGGTRSWADRRVRSLTWHRGGAAGPTRRLASNGFVKLLRQPFRW